MPFAIGKVAQDKGRNHHDKGPDCSNLTIV